jgi:hypothetical protein
MAGFPDVFTTPIDLPPNRSGIEPGPGILIEPGSQPNTTKVSVKSTFPFFDSNGAHHPIVLNP